jgi:hypothetical protein
LIRYAIGIRNPQSAIRDPQSAIGDPHSAMTWSMDDWRYAARETVTDPQGRRWVVALMDVLGQEGDPEVPGELLQLQYASGRYFTIIYAPGGGLQREEGFASLSEAEAAYERLVAAVAGGRLNPAQPVFTEGESDDV